MRGLAALVLLLGCSSMTETAQPEPLPAPAPVKPHVPNLDREVDVFVNHDRVTTLSPTEVAAGAELDRVVFSYPLRDWASITVYRDGSDTVEWLDPETNFAGLVPFVYLDGDRPAAAFLERHDLSTHANAVVKATAITAVRIQIRPHVRTPLEQVAQGCILEPKGEQPVLLIPEHWKGTTRQFNIPMNWRTDLQVKLGDDLQVGAKVGVLTQYAVEWEQKCVYDLFKMADRNDRRGVRGILRHAEGGCVDSLYELTCAGTGLALWGYYGNGRYVERGVLTAVP